MVLMNGLRGDPHRVLEDGAQLRQPLGARRHDVGLAQLVEQVGAQDAHQLRGAGGAEDERRHPQVLAQVPEARQAPRRVQVFRGEQPADAGAEIGEGEVHHHQGQQEAGHRQADEADEGEHVIRDGVLPHRRVDADRDGQNPGENDRREGQQGGQQEAVADHLHDRPLPFHGDAEIALQHEPYPSGVLRVQGLVEAVLDAQVLGFLLRHQRARRHELGDVGGDVVPRRQLDDGEGDHRDHPHRYPGRSAGGEARTRPRRTAPI